MGLKQLLLLPQSSPSGSQSADANAGKRRKGEEGRRKMKKS